MTGVTAVLTEWQYMELVAYEDGTPTWCEKRPNTNLIRRNMLALAPRCGPGFYCITEFGLAALAAFREKNAVAV